MCLSLCLVASTVTAAEVTGRVLALDQCPGDSIETTTGADARGESFLMSLLFPILKFGVGAGLKALGSHFTEEANEQTVDVIHHGDYLYAWSDVSPERSAAGFVPKAKCLILTSQGVADTKESLGGLIGAYEAKATKIDLTSGAKTETWNAASPALLKKLTGMGYDSAAKTKPALIGVFDVEVSQQGTSMRLRPRFLVNSHSIREQKADTKNRDFTFEFKFRRPGTAEPFGNTLIKFESVERLVPVTHHVGEGIYSEWFSFPKVDEEVLAQVEALKKAQASKSSATKDAMISGAAAVKLGATEITMHTNPQTPCPSSTAILQRLIAAKANLVAETAKKTPDEALTARYTQESSYYSSCQDYRAAEEIEKSGFKSGYSALTYDLFVTVKEFRERPVAKFLGKLLGDDTTRTALTTALTSPFDPQARATANAAAATALATKRGDLEEAIVEAEKAVVAYTAAADGSSDKSTKYIDMEAKKRSANRLADALGVKRPYEGAGAWVFGSG